MTSIINQHTTNHSNCLNVFSHLNTIISTLVRYSKVIHSLKFYEMQNFHNPLDFLMYIKLCKKKSLNEKNEKN